MLSGVAGYPIDNLCNIQRQHSQHRFLLGWYKYNAFVTSIFNDQGFRPHARRRWAMLSLSCCHGLIPFSWKHWIV